MVGTTQQGVSGPQMLSGMHISKDAQQEDATTGTHLSGAVVPTQGFAMSSMRPKVGLKRW